MNGLGFAILLAMAAFTIWAAYMPTKKKPEAATPGRITD